MSFTYRLRNMYFRHNPVYVYLKHIDSSNFLDAAKKESNDNSFNSTSCSELVSNTNSNEDSTIETKDTALKCEVQNSQTQDNDNSITSENSSQEKIDFKVIYNKQRINVNFALDGTVAELKAHLQNIISVPQAMQKVMIKRLAKDEQTLRSLGVTKGIIANLINNYLLNYIVKHLLYVLYDTFKVPKSW